MLTQQNMKLSINSTILTWARERNGFSIEELGEKTDISPYEIEMWEAGIEVPTICSDLNIDCIDLEKFLEQQDLKY
jgi:transcriptional regulator with XRE-family HTH domain